MKKAKAGKYYAVHFLFSWEILATATVDLLCDCSFLTHLKVYKADCPPTQYILLGRQIINYYAIIIL